MKTREEIEALSDEERRIKTAEMCGWKCHESTGAWGDAPNYTWTNPQGWIAFSDDQAAAELPDYSNSLDAMHEAEIACLKTDEDYLIYLYVLRALLPEDRNRRIRFCISASAKDRNTALLMMKA